jgi:AraC-like DNA-binding protein
MGLVPFFIIHPSPLAAPSVASDHVADDRLCAWMHMHNLDDLLTRVAAWQASRLASRTCASTFELRNLIDAHRSLQDGLSRAVRQRHLHRERRLHFVDRYSALDHGQLPGSYEDEDINAATDKIYQFVYTQPSFATA